MKRLIGVTGSMGCGKTYACEQLIAEKLVQDVEINYINVDSVRRKVNGNYSSYSSAVEKALIEDLQRKSGLVLIEWARLVEDNLLTLVDNNILLIKCSYNKQIERLRGGDLPSEEIERRINAQFNNDEKEQRIRAIQALEGGQLYVFDTTQDPSREQYRKLLETIVGDLQ